VHFLNDFSVISTLLSQPSKPHEGAFLARFLPVLSITFKYFQPEYLYRTMPAG
jgi:hypothetical protein